MFEKHCSIEPGELSMLRRGQGSYCQGPGGGGDRPPPPLGLSALLCLSQFELLQGCPLFPWTASEHLHYLYAYTTGAELN